MLKKLVVLIAFCFIVCLPGCVTSSDTGGASNSGVTPSTQSASSDESQAAPTTKAEIAADDGAGVNPDTAPPTQSASPDDTPQLNNETPAPATETPITPDEGTAVTLIVSGKKLTFDGQQPIAKDGEVFVPVYGVFENLYGANDNKDAPFTVKLDETTRIVTVRNAWYNVTVTANDLSMIPLLEVAKAIDATVEWDKDAQTISVFYESMIKVE
jgi:hypothetical protein